MKCFSNVASRNVYNFNKIYFLVASRQKLLGRNRLKWWRIKDEMDKTHKPRYNDSVRVVGRKQDLLQRERDDKEDKWDGLNPRLHEKKKKKNVDPGRILRDRHTEFSISEALRVIIIKTETKRKYKRMINNNKIYFDKMYVDTLKIKLKVNKNKKHIIYKEIIRSFHHDGVRYCTNFLTHPFPNQIKNKTSSPKMSVY